MVAGIKERGFLNWLFVRDPGVQSNFDNKFETNPHWQAKGTFDGISQEASDKWAQFTAISKGERQTFTLKSFPFDIGRAFIPDGITLDDKSVSSRHAFINYENGCLTVTDAGSKNGTYVNGQRIPVGEATQVAKSHELKLGRTVIAVDDFYDINNAIGATGADLTEFLDVDLSDI